MEIMGHHCWQLLQQKLERAYFRETKPFYCTAPQGTSSARHRAPLWHLLNVLLTGPSREPLGYHMNTSSELHRHLNSTSPRIDGTDGTLLAPHRHLTSNLPAPHCNLIAILLPYHGHLIGTSFASYCHLTAISSALHCHLICTSQLSHTYLIFTSLTPQNLVQSLIMFDLSFYCCSLVMQSLSKHTCFLTV